MSGGTLPRSPEEGKHACPHEPWPNGTPNWVDLAVKDIEGAKAFYSGLFGWEFLDAGEEAGNYNLASKDGAQVAGIGPAQDENWPTVWTTYIAADDADAVAAKVTAAGGMVLAPPFDVMDSGRMFIGADTAGAAFGVWQAKSHIGASRYNEHGALIWNELHTRDFAGAQTFYGAVFGYTFDDISAEGFTYATFKTDGAEIGGLHHDTDLPDGVPNYWMTWFGSDDVDASAAKVAELGGTVLFEPSDSAFGRMTIVQGPQGEAFGIISVGAGS